MRIGSALILLLACLAGAVAQEGDVAPADRFEQAIPGLAQRLIALHPSRPDEYLELGEEVLVEIPTPAGRNLARELLVLAFELDPIKGGPSPQRASACLALASISRDEAERQWLRMLAATMSAAPLSLAPGGVELKTDSQRSSLAIEVAELLAAIRAENATTRRRAARRPEIVALLDAVAPSLGATRREILHTLEDRPVCPQCGSRRTVRARDADEAIPVELCPTCGGNPGARLQADEMLRSLRVEAMLIEARARTWSGSLLQDGGAPIRESAGSSIASFYDVDPKAPFWRPHGGGPRAFGSWVGQEPGA